MYCQPTVSKFIPACCYKVERKVSYTFRNGMCFKDDIFFGRVIKRRKKTVWVAPFSKELYSNNFTIILKKENGKFQ